MPNSCVVDVDDDVGGVVDLVGANAVGVWMLTGSVAKAVVGETKALTDTDDALRRQSQRLGVRKRTILIVWRMQQRY